MVKLQKLIPLFAIFIALFPLARCDSFVTVTEDEAVQFEFPYPCDSNKVTIQSANRAPFYSSAEPEYLNLPSYQLNRFSVTDKNCSVQVEINPVNRNDEATYICQAYRDGVIYSRFTRIRLNVNYPPGDVFCALSINYDAVGDWVLLECTAPVGSLAGGIYCYQDSKQLPPQSKLVQFGETLKQTVWVSKEHPAFCCSAILDLPKYSCDCKDFVWNPMGYIFQTKNILDPCHDTTSSQIAILSQYPEREDEDNSQLPKLIESLNLTDTNKDKSTANNSIMFWMQCAVVIVTGVMVMILLIIQMRSCVVEKTPKQLKKCQNANIHQHISMVEKETPFTSSQQKENFLHVFSSNEHSITRPKSW